MKGDPDCPYINIRIILEKTDFTTLTFRIQILNFVFACAPYERLISLSRLKILYEQTFTIQNNHQVALRSLEPSNGSSTLLIELEKLVIRRLDKADNKLFHIHYIDGEPVNDVNLNYMKIVSKQSLTPPTGRKLQSSSSMLVNNASPSKQTKMLNSIIQF